MKGPVEGPRAGHRAYSINGAQNKNSRLPRTLSNVLNAIQEEILQLDVTCADAPVFLDFGRPLVGLPDRVTLRQWKHVLP